MILPARTLLFRSICLLLAHHFGKVSVQGVDVVPAHGLLHPIRGKKRNPWFLFGQCSCWRSCSYRCAAKPFLPIQSFFDSRIVPEVFFRCVVVTATVDMVAHAYAVREGNLSRLVDITGEAGFPAALRTDGLAARTVFLKMESVFGHDALFCGFLQVETVICSLQFLQSCRKYLFLEP